MLEELESSLGILRRLKKKIKNLKDIFKEDLKELERT